MNAWWESLSSYQQVLFAIAAAATLIMIIFLVLMLIGIGDDEIDDFDIDVDEPVINFSGLKIFTLRGTLAFLSVGGWVAFLLEQPTGPVWATILGMIAGAIAAILMALAFRAAMKLEQEGNLDYKNAINKVGRVYLRIPAKRSGLGKVNITIQDRYVEVDAVTDEEEPISTGLEVVVVDIISESTLVVKKR